MKIKRTLPPAGAPLRMSDYLAGLRGMTWPSRAIIELENSIKDFFGARHVFLTSSGKAALTVVLQAMADIRKRTKVIIPSYTCFSVPAAVVKAGLRPVVCDVERNSIDYDMNRLKKLLGGDILCVLASHTFGIPCDVPSLSALAHLNGSFVVEDCAQAMGARLDSDKTGTMADLGFFSLGRGKNVCAVSGGIVITNDDVLAGSVARKLSRLAGGGLREKAIPPLVAAFLLVFSRPSLYWLPAGMPVLGLGKTVYSTDFPVGRLTGFAAGLAADWQARLERYNRLRRERAAEYKRHLAQLGFGFITEPADAVSAYPRFPVLARPDERESLCNRLSRAGLGASANYPSSVAEIPELPLSQSERNACPNGTALAKSIITLPTHPHTTQADVLRIVKTMRAVEDRVYRESYPESAAL